MKRLCVLLLVCVPALFVPSCAGGPGGADSSFVQRRNASILSEPRGDWYIGRRYFTEKTRYWGYLRRPGESWDKAKLVVIDDDRGVRPPDRLPESPAGAGLAHGYDHNHEYKIWGRFTTRTVYDPNADMELPTFAADKFELINPSPGYLFSPADVYKPRYIPAREAHRQTPRRM